MNYNKYCSKSALHIKTKDGNVVRFGIKEGSLEKWLREKKRKK